MAHPPPPACRLAGNSAFARMFHMEVGTLHLASLTSIRTEPAAGLHLSLTRRCPLSCAHCSTNSMLSSEEHAAEPFLRFVETFTVDNRPEVILLTGGEPLLRPRLVAELAERARAVGTRVCLISGMFFARRPRIPLPISRAVGAVDHFTASLDVFHEEQVPRAAVFRVMGELLDRGQDVSFQVTGLNEEDPYLVEVTDDIRRSFDDRVPMVVRHVGPVGRAKLWLDQPAQPARTAIAPMPCSSAAWPVVAFDGTVVACCNQDVVDGPVPAHLHLGHIATDDWATVRERCLESPMLRAVRAFGPEYVADRYGEGKVTCDGYCATCFKLGSEPALGDRVNELVDRPVMRLIEEQMASLQEQEWAGQYLAPAYTSLLRLGVDADRRAACAG